MCTSAPAQLTHWRMHRRAATTTCGRLSAQQVPHAPAPPACGRARAARSRRISHAAVRLGYPPLWPKRRAPANVYLMLSVCVCPPASSARNYCHRRSGPQICGGCSPLAPVAGGSLRAWAPLLAKTGNPRVPLPIQVIELTHTHTTAPAPGPRPDR